MYHYFALTASLGAKGLVYCWLPKLSLPVIATTQWVICPQICQATLRDGQLHLLTTMTLGVKQQHDQPVRH